MYNIDDRKEETILEPVNGVDVSSNGEKLIVQTKIAPEADVDQRHAAQRDEDGHRRRRRAQLPADRAAELAALLRDLGIDHERMRRAMRHAAVARQIIEESVPVLLDSLGPGVESHGEEGA